MCQHKWDEALSETMETTSNVNPCSRGRVTSYFREMVPCALCESLRVTFRQENSDGSSTEKVVIVESGWDLDR